MQRPFSIYCDWAFHDELGDLVELDEAMTMTALDTLAGWRARHGVGFDYYLLDAFWFDPGQPYTAFKRPHWPRGFAPALARIRELGMLPGLWFDLSGSHLQVAEWAPSYDPERRAHSLAYGPYGPSLEAGWRHALETWGVRLFKLDFANLSARPPGCGWATPEEAGQANGAALRSILSRLRAEYPDLVIIAYNGIERWPGYLSRPMGSPTHPGFDLSWLEVFDYVYSGDPRPSDLPRTDLRRSIDAFQDHQVWLLSRLGFPMERIDDHGCMVGGTNTSFYQGAHGFRRTYLAHLARGGRRDLYYGDPTLLADGDVAFMAAARRLYFDAFGRGLSTAWLGGEPGVAPWHGCLTGGAARGLLSLVNGPRTSQQIELALPGLARATALYADAGPDAAVQIAGEGALLVELAPEQMAVIGLGAYASADLALTPAADCPVPRRMRPLDIAFAPTGPGELTGVWRGAPPQTDEVVVFAQAHSATDASGVGGGGLPVRFGQETTREGQRPAEPASREQVHIELTVGGRPIAPLRILPDVPIWAGISWVGVFYAASALADGAELRVRQHGGAAGHTLRVRALAVER